MDSNLLYKFTLIDSINVVVKTDAEVFFALESKPIFTSYGNALFNYTSKRIFPGEILNTCSQRIQNLSDYILNPQIYENYNDYLHDEFSGLIHEEQINGDRDFVYVERWSLCTKIPLEEFLQLFLTFEEYLKKWSNTDFLINTIKDKFIYLKNNEFRNNYKPIPIDAFSYILFWLEDKSMEMEPDVFIKSLELPKF